MKIYGTIGPSSNKKEIISGMIRAGMNGIRLNLSHGMLSSFESAIDELRQAEKECGANIELVIDLEGPELRIGALSGSLNLVEGELISLGDQIPLNKFLTDQLMVGMICRLDDGKIEVEVTEKTDSGCLCRIIRGGLLLPRKSFSAVGHTFSVPLLTDNDLINLKTAKNIGVNAILQPFVRCAKDVVDVRKALNELGCKDIEIIAKIEDHSGVNNIDEIIEVADRLLFARGDLGNCMDMWLLPKLQKNITHKCVAAGKPIIIATQLLSSMEKNPVPTRAEMNDIYNSAIDGAEGLMLTGETAAGKYPVESIMYLTNAASQALKDKI